MRGSFSPFSNGNLSLYDELYEDRASLNKYKAVRKTVSGDSVKNIILNIRTPYWQCKMKPWSPLAPELIPGFCSMKRIGVFLLPLHGRDASPSQVIPPQFPQQFAGTHLYSWVQRGTESVLPKNTTQSPGPGLEPGPWATNHEATVPPIDNVSEGIYSER